jgi:hypothetical protein
MISAQASGALIEERVMGQVSVAASRFAVECRGTPNMAIACTRCDPPHLEGRAQGSVKGDH